MGDKGTGQFHSVGEGLLSRVSPPLMPPTHLEPTPCREKPVNRYLLLLTERAWGNHSLL